jgi:hypothetical protein
VKIARGDMETCRIWNKLDRLNELESPQIIRQNSPFLMALSLLPNLLHKKYKTASNLTSKQPCLRLSLLALVRQHFKQHRYSLCSCCFIGGSEFVRAFAFDNAKLFHCCHCAFRPRWNVLVICEFGCGV